jgi:hypothetical protein
MFTTRSLLHSSCRCTKQPSQLFTSGGNPTDASYNVSVVKIYALGVLKTKNIFFEVPLKDALAFCNAGVEFVNS